MKEAESLARVLRGRAREVEAAAASKVQANLRGKKARKTAKGIKGKGGSTSGFGPNLAWCQINMYYYLVALFVHCFLSPLDIATELYDSGATELRQHAGWMAAVSMMVRQRTRRAAGTRRRRTAASGSSPSCRSPCWSPPAARRQRPRHLRTRL